MCVPYSKLSAGVDLVSVVVPRVVEVVANTKRVIYLLAPSGALIAIPTYY